VRIRVIPSPNNSEVIDGELFYREREFSFDFVARAGAVDWVGGASLLIGTLSLELDPDTGRLLYVWGLHPHTHWREATLEPGIFTSGTVYADRSGGFTPGVSVQIAAVSEWETLCDPESGWLALKPRSVVQDDARIRVASSTAVGVSAGVLTSVWLHPKRVFD